MTIVGLIEALANNNEPWQASALCAQTDPEMFFPDVGGSTRDAKKVCQACPVAQECLAYALRTNQAFGIFGGYSERERRRMKKGLAPKPRRTHCGRGHEFDKVVRTAQGACRECRRVWERAAQARARAHGAA